MPIVASWPIIELRHYLLHPFAREQLIALFDAEFVEPQEDAGMQLIAQFRDIDRPDVFTWMRGFPDMCARAASLAAFYDGPVWARHRDAANATMINSDDVRLLRAVRRDAALRIDADRPAISATAIAPGLMVVDIYPLRDRSVHGFAEWFESSMVPRVAAAGAQPFALYETAPFENTFPRLPVRECEHAFVSFTRYADAADYDRHAAHLAGDDQWVSSVLPQLRAHLAGPAIVWRLTPTARSLVLR
jgi:NIPSNAP protein